MFIQQNRKFCFFLPFDIVNLRCEIASIHAQFMNFLYSSFLSIRFVCLVRVKINKH